MEIRDLTRSAALLLILLTTGMPSALAQDPFDGKHNKMLQQQNGVKFRAGAMFAAPDFKTSPEFKEIENWVRGLCPAETSLGSHAEYMGEEDQRIALHKGLDYQSRKLFLLFALSEMEKTASTAGENEATKNLKSLIAEIRPKLIADKIPLATGMMDGPTAAIVRTTGGDALPPSFMFGKEFLPRFFESPQYYLGVIAHEFRHYSDLTNPELGPNHDLVRYTRAHESRGHWQEAEYFRMLPDQVQKADPRVAEHILAAKDGPESAGWNAHLNEHQGEDFQLRDQVEKLFYKTALEKDSNDFVKEDLGPLTERMVRTTSEVLALRDNLQKDPEQKQLHEQLRQKIATLQTFLKLQISFHTEWEMHGPKNRDSEELANKKKTMAKGFKLIGLGNDLVVENPDLKKIILRNSETHTPNNPLPKDAFAKWVENNPDVATFQRSARKALCDTEGKERRQIWAEMDGKKNPTPKLPGLDAEKIAQDARERQDALRGLENENRLLEAQREKALQPQGNRGAFKGIAGNRLQMPQPIPMQGIELGNGRNNGGVEEITSARIRQLEAQLMKVENENDRFRILQAIQHLRMRGAGKANALLVEIDDALAPGEDRPERLKKLSREALKLAMDTRGPFDQAHPDLRLLLMEYERRNREARAKLLERLTADFEGLTGRPISNKNRDGVLKAMDTLQTSDNLAASGRNNHFYKPLFAELSFKEAKMFLGEGGKFRNSREMAYGDDLALEAHYGQKITRKIVPAAAGSFVEYYHQGMEDPLDRKMFEIGDRELRAHFGADWDVPQAKKALRIVDIGLQWGATPKSQLPELQKLPVAAQRAAIRMLKKISPDLAKEFEQLMKPGGKP